MGARRLFFVASFVFLCALGASATVDVMSRRVQLQTPSFAYSGHQATRRRRSASAGPKKPSLALTFQATVHATDGSLREVTIDHDRLMMAVGSSDTEGLQSAEGFKKPRDSDVLDFMSNRQIANLRFFGETVCYAFDLIKDYPAAKLPDAKKRDFADRSFRASMGEIAGMPLALYDSANQYAGWKNIGVDRCYLWTARHTQRVELAKLMARPEMFTHVEAAPKLAGSLREAVQEYVSANASDANHKDAIVSADISLCVTKSGEMLEANVSHAATVEVTINGETIQKDLWRNTQSSTALYKHGRSITSADFATGRCVDLTQGHVGPSELQKHLNDPERLSRINSEAALGWEATAYDLWDGVKVDEVIRTLGTEIGPLSLPLQGGLKKNHSLFRGGSFAKGHKEPLPEKFDPRAHWPMCPSIGTVRNQGQCGSCWAFAAATVLADRFCIASAKAQTGTSFLQSHVNKSGLLDLTLAPAHLVDCDGNDYGCEGGRTDNVWWYLRDHGVPAEACRPYPYCPVPTERSCQGRIGLIGRSAQQPADKCHGACEADTPMQFFRASTAYAVSVPGDVESMQRELMLHGPVQVAFFVFSDFHNYRRGVYFRTPGAYGPMGGHAVRMLGWGNSSAPVGNKKVKKLRKSKSLDYWLVANSWSPHWGMAGNFRIRRGTNECGIETVPAAGLPQFSRGMPAQ